MKSATRTRRLSITEKRYLGLYPRGANIGDQVCVFLGACVTFVIRKLRGRNEYQLVGECYVHDIMDGEAECMGDLQRTEIFVEATASLQRCCTLACLLKETVVTCSPGSMNEPCSTMLNKARYSSLSDAK